MFSEDVNSINLSTISSDINKLSASKSGLHHLNRQIKLELHQTLAKREAMRILKKGNLTDIKSILKKYQVS